MKMFINLLPELREQILTYCSINDVRNLAQTSSEYNQELKGILFRIIDIPSSKSINERLKTAVDNLQNTQVLRINFNHLSQSSLEAINQLDNLLELKLYGSEQIDESKIHILCKGLAGLKKLDVSGCSGVTDTWISHIAKLVRLEELLLSSSSEITDIGLSYIVTEEFKRAEFDV